MHPPHAQAPLLGYCFPSYLQGPRPLAPTPHTATLPWASAAPATSRGLAPRTHPPHTGHHIPGLLLAGWGPHFPTGPATSRGLDPCTHPTHRHPSWATASPATSRGLAPLHPPHTQAPYPGLLLPQLPPGALPPRTHPHTQAPLLGFCCPSYLQGPCPLEPTPHTGTLPWASGRGINPPPPGTLRTLRTCGPTLKHPSPG